MTNREKYADFVKRGAALEIRLEAEGHGDKKYGWVSLLDENVTRENMDRSIPYDTEEYYAELLRVAEMELGMRLEAMGLAAKDYGFKY